MSAIPDEFKPVIDRLLSYYPQIEGRVLTGKYKGLDRIARGWFQQVQEACGGIMVLTEAGLPYTTATLRRSVVEHLIALKWLMKDGEKAVDTTGRAVAMKIKELHELRLQHGLESMTEKQLDDMMAVAESVDKSGDTYASFAHRAKRVDAKIELVEYLDVTQLCHPNVVTAMMHFEEPSPKYSGAEQAGFVAIYMLWALEQLNKMYKPMPWPALVAEMGPRIQRAAQAVDRRTRG